MATSGLGREVVYEIEDYWTDAPSAVVLLNDHGGPSAGTEIYGKGGPRHICITCQVPYGRLFDIRQNLVSPTQILKPAYPWCSTGHCAHSGPVAAGSGQNFEGIVMGVEGKPDLSQMIRTLRPGGRLTHALDCRH